MTDRDKRIIEEATKAVNENLGAGCYVYDLLNIIINLKAENDKQANELKITRQYLHDNGLEWDLLSYVRKKEKLVGE